MFFWPECDVSGRLCVTGGCVRRGDLKNVWLNINLLGFRSQWLAIFTLLGQVASVAAT
jgi:hypothetical protein